MEYVVDAFHAGGLADVAVDTFTVSSPVDHGFTADRARLRGDRDTGVPVLAQPGAAEFLSRWDPGPPALRTAGRIPGLQRGKRSRGASSWSIFDGREPVSQRADARRAGCPVLRQRSRRGDQQPGPAQDPGRARRRAAFLGSGPAGGDGPGGRAVRRGRSDDPGTHDVGTGRDLERHGLDTGPRRTAAGGRRHGEMERPDRGAVGVLRRHVGRARTGAGRRERGGHRRHAGV